MIRLNLMQPICAVVCAAASTTNGFGGVWRGNRNAERTGNSMTMFFPQFVPLGVVARIKYDNPPDAEPHNYMTQVDHIVCFVRVDGAATGGHNQFV